MRTRREIIEELDKVPESTTIPEFKSKRDHLVAKLQLEVLLDIRDLLDTRPAITHPASPPAPEVKR